MSLVHKSPITIKISLGSYFKKDTAGTIGNEIKTLTIIAIAQSIPTVIIFCAHFYMPP